MEKGERTVKIRYYSVGGMGTNCYIVSDKNGRTAIIDPGGDAKRILDDVKLNNLTVDYILLTHAHFDHIMATQELREATDAQVCVGAGDAPMLADAQYNLSAMVYPTQAVNLSADRLLTDGDAITFGDVTLSVIETPGHTRGSVCYAGDGVLFSGDTLFAGSIGRTDLPGGDMTVMRKSLMRLCAITEDVVVYPGHGEETTLAFQKAANPYLVF